MSKTVRLKTHQKQKPILYKVIVFIGIAWGFITFNFIHAEEQYYTYASDIVKPKKNINSIDKQDKWRYQHETPFAFQKNTNLQQKQYRYPAPVQKPGSNPITNPQHKAQFPSNSKFNSERNYYVNEHQYNYPPPTQKHGSNPFINPSKQYNSLWIENISQHRDELR